MDFPFTREFAFERATPGTLRFKEVSNDQPLTLRSVYIEKWVFAGKGEPKKIKVTVELVE